MSGELCRRLAAMVGVLCVTVPTLVGCGGSEKKPAPDPVALAEAREAAIIWFSAMWRNDYEASCPNIRTPRSSSPPLGGCGQGSTNISRSMNPDGEPLTSVVITKFSLDGNQAEFDSDHVTVNGRPLAENIDRAAGDGHTRYTYKFIRVYDLWYYQTADWEARL